jgi:hypothetical protein
MGFKEIMANREARILTPEFGAKIDKEKQEFIDILKSLGNNSLDAGYNVILETPFKIFMNGMKLIYKEKYTGEKFSKDFIKLFFGPDGTFHNLTKVAANAVHLSGKGAKIGIRKLFAI